MDHLTQRQSEAIYVIAFYFIISICWLVQSAARFKWESDRYHKFLINPSTNPDLKWYQKKWVTRFILGAAALVYAYRNYHFFFDHQGKFQADDGQLNLICTIAVTFSMLWETIDYFIHLHTWVKRAIKNIRTWVKI